MYVHDNVCAVMYVHRGYVRYIVVGIRQCLRCNTRGGIHFESAPRARTTGTVYLKYLIRIDRGGAACAVCAHRVERTEGSTQFT